MSQSDLLASHFDEAFSAPDGLKRLRELILTLAMQGKLVEHDPAEGTTDDLLRDIETEKQRLVHAGKIKQPKALPAIAPEEVPYELPQGWRWVRFGQLVDVLNGRAYKQQELLEIETGLPVLRVGNLFTSNKWYYSDLNLEEDKHIDSGDLIYAWSASFGPFIWRGGKVIYHYHIWKLRLNIDSVILKEYLYNFLKHQTESIKQSGNGIAMLHMTKERMELLLTPLPPLAEQQRIVARIDQLMARCEELEALRAQREQKRVQVHTAILREITADTDPAVFQQNWQFLADHFGELHATPQNVAELRSAILQLAVMGKLVPQDPAEGTGRELLAEIEEEKRRLVAAGKIKAPKPLAPVGVAEQPYPVPEGWAWVRLGTISTTRLGKMLDASKNRGAFKPYLRNTNVQWEKFELGDIKEMRLEAEELEEFAVGYGDLLVCEGGEPGRCAIWRENQTEMYFQKALHRVRPFSPIMPEWILFNLKNDARSKMLSRYFTGATIKHFPGEKLVTYFLALPPAAEQHRIVAKVDQLMGLCDLLESRLRERTAKQGELLRAVMAELAPTLLSTRPAVTSRARAQAPAGTDALRGRGRSRKAAPEGTEVALQLVGERRGRGRPRKEGSSTTRSIPEASSMEDAIQRLEALKLKRAAGSRQVGLFED